MEGLGIPQDVKLAEACYLKAAEMGQTDTMNHNKFSLPKGIFKDLSGKEPFQYVPRQESHCGNDNAVDQRYKVDHPE